MYADKPMQGHFGMANWLHSVKLASAETAKVLKVLKVLTCGASYAIVTIVVDKHVRTKPSF